MAEPWRPRVTVAAVIRCGERFLLVEEWVDGALRLNQPAGHLEPDEGLAEAMCREVLEETGYRVEPEGIIAIYRWRHLREGPHLPAHHLCGAVRHPSPGAVPGSRHPSPHLADRRRDCRRARAPAQPHGPAQRRGLSPGSAPPPGAAPGPAVSACYHFTAASA
ncbi:MAG: NUDIX domain-containing protein [Arhodomonas sp.]|nr:NUDIX domain-containing protein [Arhodomonas sp.]